MDQHVVDLCILEGYLWDSPHLLWFCLFIKNVHNSLWMTSSCSMELQPTRSREKQHWVVHPDPSPQQSLSWAKQTWTTTQEKYAKWCPLPFPPKKLQHYPPTPHPSAPFIFPAPSVCSWKLGYIIFSVYISIIPLKSPTGSKTQVGRGEGQGQ